MITIPRRGLSNIYQITSIFTFDLYFIHFSLYCYLRKQPKYSSKDQWVNKTATQSLSVVGESVLRDWMTAWLSAGLTAPLSP